MRICLIAALSSNGVIGRDNQMPWHLPCDLKHFKRVTSGKPILMGRKTFESIGRPLPGRTNVVITHQNAWRAKGVEVVHGLAEGLALAESLPLNDSDEEVMVIGGAQIYREALSAAQRLYLTRVHARVEGDTYFPEIRDDEWREVSREEHKAEATNPYDHSFVVLDRIASHGQG
ncbi:MAG: type 3 dihydrofolate reductase [Cellvibrionaceae bacterium]